MDCIQRARFFQSVGDAVFAPPTATVTRNPVGCFWCGEVVNGKLSSCFIPGAGLQVVFLFVVYKCWGWKNPKYQTKPLRDAFK